VKSQIAQAEKDKVSNRKHLNNNYLEFDDNKNRIDLANIVKNNEEKLKENKTYFKSKMIKERDNSPEFQDDSDVPPLM